MSPCKAESNLTVVCPGYEPISGIWTRDLNKDQTILKTTH